MLETGLPCDAVDNALRPPAVPQAGWLATLVQTWLDWRARAQQRRQLGALSAHMLNDIGLTSADVHAELGKRPWQS